MTARSIYIGGQNAIDAAGEVVGAGDIRAQAGQAVRNLRAALAGAGADLEHLVKCTIYVVAGLAHPDYLIEIDAIAAASAEG